MKIQQLMTRDVYSVGPGDSAQVAALVMWNHDCGAVPVVDRARAVVGMITDRDICMAALTQGRTLDEIPVSLAMSRAIYTCREDDPVEIAEATMREKQVRRLPIVDELGNLVGILSINDLVRGGHSMASRSRGLRPEALAQTLAAVSAPRDATH